MYFFLYNVMYSNSLLLLSVNPLFNERNDEF